MSIKLLSECWTRQIRPVSKREVLMVLCDHANDEGLNARPSVARIAWKTDLSTRQVQRILRGLVNDKAIRVQRAATQDMATTYRVVPGVYPEKPPFAGRGDRLSPQRREVGELLSLFGGDKLSPGGVTFPTERGDILAGRGDIAMSPEPSYESLGENLSSSFSSREAPERDGDGSLAVRIDEFLQEREISDPARGDLIQKYSTFEDGLVELVEIYSACFDPKKLVGRTDEARRGAFINKAKARYQSTYRWPSQRKKEGVR